MWYISLWLFSCSGVISGILVITSKKAVNAIISLIAAFLNGIGAFLLLGVDFIAIIYCIVYVGAIAILFLFVIMLLNNNYGAPSKMVPFYGKWGVILMGSLYILTVWCGFTGNYFSGTGLGKMSDKIVSILHSKSTITSLGEMLYSVCGYEVLLVISLILLVGMIGSILLTLKKI